MTPEVMLNNIQKEVSAELLAEIDALRAERDNMTGQVKELSEKLLHGVCIHDWTGWTGWDGLG